MAAESDAALAIDALARTLRWSGWRPLGGPPLRGRAFMEDRIRELAFERETPGSYLALSDGESIHVAGPVSSDASNAIQAGGMAAAGSRRFDVPDFTWRPLPRLLFSILFPWQRRAVVWGLGGAHLLAAASLLGLANANAWSPLLVAAFAFPGLSLLTVAAATLCIGVASGVSPLVFPRLVLAFNHEMRNVGLTSRIRTLSPRLLAALLPGPVAALSGLGGLSTLVLSALAASLLTALALGRWIDALCALAPAAASRDAAPEMCLACNRSMPPGWRFCGGCGSPRSTHEIRREATLPRP